MIYKIYIQDTSKGLVYLAAHIFYHMAQFGSCFRGRGGGYLVSGIYVKYHIMEKGGG